MEKNKNEKKGVIMGLVACALMLAGFLGSYAFFITSINNSKNQGININTGTISLIFTDGNPGFNKKLNFGESAEKEFKIENNGTIEALAKINWKNLINTFLNNSLTYSLSYYENEDNIPVELLTNKKVPRSEYSTTIELANGIVIPANTTYTFILTITLNNLSIDQTEDLKATLNTEFSIEEGNETATQELVHKSNKSEVATYKEGNIKEMYTFLHPLTEQTAGWTEKERTDYRYIGNVPNNYIQFNDEMWRILGIFTVEGENAEKEQRIKIIRNTSIGNLSWNNNDGIYSENYWDNATLKILLNQGSYYNKLDNYSSIGLNEIAKSQISSSRWHLGSSRSNTSISGSDYYNFERDGNISTLAKIGLIYPSDYAYTFAKGVNDYCFNTTYSCINENAEQSWLHNRTDQWMITPLYGNNVISLKISSAGGLVMGQVSDAFSVRPSLFLNSDIEISSGDGSYENPYIIKS